MRLVLQTTLFKEIMESQVARQRVSIIAAHLAALPEDFSATAAQVFPMSCRNNNECVIRRRDNSMIFARQGSSSQASYMRQMSNKQDGHFQKSCRNNNESAIRRRDNSMIFARQGSSYQASYMRQMSNKQDGHFQPAIPFKSPYCANKPSASVEAPTYLGPAREEPNFQNVGELGSVVQSCRYNEAAVGAPNFARSNQIREDSQSYVEERAFAVGPNGSLTHYTGSNWSPRMDVAESGQRYVVTIELPGVPIDNIRVEVKDLSLMITGDRSKMTNNPNDSFSIFHKREILQGPFKAVWSLPTNSDKERVSAEFVEGLLRITIPKLSGSRTMMRENLSQ